jgi:type III secretory pathway lipoprotein EscJ
VNQLITSRICREDSGIERNQSSKKTTVTHNSVFAAHRLQCRMTIRKIDIRHFVFEAMRDVATQNLVSP